MGQSVDIDFSLPSGSPWRIRLAAYKVKTDSTRSEILTKPLLNRYIAPDPAVCPENGGSAIITATIETSGSPKSVKPQIPDTLGAAGAKAVASWRFQPGTANGKPREASAIIELDCGSSPTTEPSPRAPVGNSTKPIPIFHPDPSYTKEALEAKWSGNVVLSIVVDATGHARNIRVISPLGLGLDEKAVEAVKTWRFTPGKTEGRPVPFNAQINVSFRVQ
jgi:TonB family protein